MAIALLLLASMALLLALAAPASARPGDLDPTYGHHGVADWPGIDKNREVGGHSVLDGSDRILALGPTPGKCCDQPTALFRTTPAGTPDPSFGDGGVVVVGKRDWWGAGLAVQPNGRVLVLLGQYADGNCPCRFRLYRLLPDGEIDPTLNGIEVPIETKYNRASLQVDPSGRILVPGDSGVVGLTAGGEVDTAFGEDGVVTVGDDDSVAELERDPTGGYLIGWVRIHPPNEGANITKIESDGAIDTDWGSGGTANVSVPAGGPSSDFELAPSPTGRVAAGYHLFDRPPAAPPANWLFVLGANGEVASDFDPQPALTMPVPSPGFSIDGLAWDDEDRLLMAGGLAPSGGTSSGCSAFLARFGEGGSPDEGFAENGLGLFPESFSTFPSCSLGSISVQSDGRILADATPSAATRFVGASGGPDDADADGVMDSDDACPRRSADHPDGCQRASLVIGLERRKRGFAGTVETDRDCLTNPGDAEAGGDFRSILLYRDGDGEDELVGSTELVGKRFEFAYKPRGQTYYAQLPEMQQPGIVVCPQARSSMVGPLTLELHARKRLPAKRTLNATARCGGGIGCNLSGRAIVKLRRPGKNLKLRSARFEQTLEAGKREQLTFKLKGRDVELLKRSLRASRQARKHSRVIFKAKARAAGQTAKSKEKARLRRG